MAQENITPLARQLAEENGLDWRKITGSGPGGLVLEGDVLEYLARQLTSPTPATPLEPPPPPSFEIDLNPQPPTPGSSDLSPTTAWPAEPPADDQPLVWGRAPATAAVVETVPPAAAEKPLSPVDAPVVTPEVEPPPAAAEQASGPLPVLAEPALSPSPAVISEPSPPLWQPVALWQRWVATEGARQAARALSQAWGSPVELHHLLLRAAQLVHRDRVGEGQVLWGRPEGDRLLTYPLPADQNQTLHQWTAQTAGYSPTPYQAKDWVVVCLGEGAVDLVSSPAVQVLGLGESREGWAPLACTGPWSAENAQAVLEAVDQYLQQPVLLV